jgi:hypothetical protein
MATVSRTKFVGKGDWRTLETFFNASATGTFEDPSGALIKVRYGVGFFGFDRQKQTLDGESVKRLEVGSGGSLARARMQIRVNRDADVTYTLILPGP